jgi:hypothetical protein
MAALRSLTAQQLHLYNVIIALSITILNYQSLPPPPPELSDQLESSGTEGTSRSGV